MGGVKKWLWSEKKIIVRSGSALCLHDDDEPASEKRGRLRLHDGGGGGWGGELATVDPRLRDTRGIKGWARGWEETTQTNILKTFCQVHQN